MAGHDLYTDAFLYFNSLDWADSFMFNNTSPDCTTNLVPTSSGFGVRGRQDSLGAVSDLIPRSLVGVQDFKFLEVRDVGVVQRLRAVAHVNFIRLFLANRVLSETYREKTRSDRFGLYENLFYSVFFDVCCFDNFFSKDKVAAGLAGRGGVKGIVNL